VLLENVSGHVSMGLFDVLSDLERLGFQTAWGLYRAEQVGAPHRRERVFILGLADCHGGGLKERGELHSEPEENRASLRNNPGRCHATLADSANNDGRFRVGKEETAARENQQRRRGSAIDSPGLADADNPGRIEQRGTIAAPEAHETFERHGWPARPGEAQFPYEPPRTLEPGLGRGSHGIPDRVDRLRALGNAVVPQQAEMAFLDLWDQLV
tara:strand:- start:95 stop:733 length:639 start_codon:yes stop_codon:yes gene_type:complete